MEQLELFEIPATIRKVPMITAIDNYMAKKCLAIKPEFGAHWLIIDGENKFRLESNNKPADMAITSLNWPWVMKDYTP